MQMHWVAWLLMFCALAQKPVAYTSRLQEGDYSIDKELETFRMNEEASEQQFQLGYEYWRRTCAPYEQQTKEFEAEPPITTRIAGGELAEPEMLPYQVGLQLIMRDGIGLQCGGALIAIHVVLTAAHCLQDAQQATIFIGTTRFAVENESAEVLRVGRGQFHIYPGYLGFGGYNDLALVHLPRNVHLNSRVQIIALALPFMDQNFLENKSVSTSGWGSLGNNGSVEEDVVGSQLRYVDVKVLEQKRCQCAFLPGLVGARRHICTDGAGSRSACEGDSGGPLVYVWHNVSYLIGLISFGSSAGCATEAPAVYTRVTMFSEWIQNELDHHDDADADDEDGAGYIN